MRREVESVRTATDLCSRREQEAREHAAQATDPRIKAILIEIADGFAQLDGRAPIAPSTTSSNEAGSISTSCPR